MEILRKSGDFNIILNQENDFQTNLGWEEGMDIFEDEVLSTIINPIDNYETVRYIHKSYSGLTGNSGDTQCDIWYKFYFIDSNNTYTNGLDYNLVGIEPKDNANMIKTSTESYFRLEFFKTPLISGTTYEPPTRINRKLVFSKNLQLPIGEKFYYNTLRQNIHIPVFMGSNYRNKENMYLFWFQDDTVLSDSTLSGNTFFMTAKFLNANDGSIIDFTTTGLTASQQIVEQRDMYYKIVIDKTDYSYKVYNYTGGTTTENNLVGRGMNNSIKFFEKRTSILPSITPNPSSSPIGASPSPTPTPTSSIGASPSPTPTSSIGASPSPTPSITITPSMPTNPTYYSYTATKCSDSSSINVQSIYPYNTPYLGHTNGDVVRVIFYNSYGVSQGEFCVTITGNNGTYSGSTFLGPGNVYLPVGAGIISGTLSGCLDAGCL
jgi:hypothetical protein